MVTKEVASQLGHTQHPPHLLGSPRCVTDCNLASINLGRAGLSFSCFLLDFTFAWKWQGGPSFLDLTALQEWTLSLGGLHCLYPQAKLKSDTPKLYLQLTSWEALSLMPCEQDRDTAAVPRLL